MSTPLAWNDAQHSLNLPAMDTTHHQFVDLLARAQAVPDGELLPALDALIEHTHAHFAAETEMMVACALGSRAEHEAEHRRVLAELAQMRDRAARGRFLLVRAYLADGVPDWFRNHLATMDADLAGKYRQYAG